MSPTPVDGRIRSAVLVHGAGGGPWEWNAWARMFTAEGIAAALPELMPVPAGLTSTRLTDYAAQVRAAALSAPAPRVLIGASLGGLLVWMNADSADALVLVNPLPAAPWHVRMPPRNPYPAIVPWRRQRSLAGTRRALFDADEAACLYAFRHWRDESGAAMNEALAGVATPRPDCRVLVIVSERDQDVPPMSSLALVDAIGADVLRLPGASHAGILLGRSAATAVAHTVAWLNVPGDGF